MIFLYGAKERAFQELRYRFMLGMPLILSQYSIGIFRVRYTPLMNLIARMKKLLLVVIVILSTHSTISPWIMRLISLMVMSNYLHLVPRMLPLSKIQQVTIIPCGLLDGGIFEIGLDTTSYWQTKNRMELWSGIHTVGTIAPQSRMIPMHRIWLVAFQRDILAIIVAIILHIRHG